MCFGIFPTSVLFSSNRKKYSYWLSLSLRLLVAAVLNLTLSEIFFQPLCIRYFEKNLCYAKECGKLRKMYELWPPYRHALLHLIYCYFFYCTMSADHSVFEDEKKKETPHTHPNCFYSFLLSTLIFMLTLPVQRINEFHFAVMILNYMHALLSGVTVTFICI